MARTKDQLEVIPQALRAEGQKWSRLSGQVATVKARASALTLTTSAFYVGDTAAIGYSLVYDDFQQFMVHLLEGAEREFAELNGALRHAADIFEQTDQDSAADITAVFGN